MDKSDVDLFYQISYPRHLCITCTQIVSRDRLQRERERRHCLGLGFVTLIKITY